MHVPFWDVGVKPWHSEILPPQYQYISVFIVLEIGIESTSGVNGVCLDGIVLEIGRESIGLLKARIVHSDTNSASLGSIQPCHNYCTNTVHPYTSTTVHSLSLVNSASWRERKCPRFKMEVK